MAAIRRVALISIFAVVCLPAAGCSDGSSGDTDAGAGTDDETDSDGIDTGIDFEIDPHRIYEDVAQLASDEWGGRQPATAGNEAALDFAENLFSELGLDFAGESGTYRQSFDYDQWTQLGPAAVALDGQALSASEYMVFQYSGGGEVTAEIVFAGYSLTVPPFDEADYPLCPVDPAAGYDDYAEIDVTDKIVVVMRHGPRDDQAIYDHCPPSEACVAEPCNWTFGYKAANAALHGAAGMILVQDYNEATGEPLEGATIDSTYYDPGFPAVFADRDAVEAALSELPGWAAAIDDSSPYTPASTASGVDATLEISAETQLVETENLLAAIPGGDPETGEEVIVVGAHIDHLGIDPTTEEIYNGADDNASGTAVVMELARAMVGHGVDPARTVVFALWNAEEVGLVGSCHYVQNPTFPLADTVAVYSIDMVGSGDGSGMGVYNGTTAEHGWIREVMDGKAEEMGLEWNVAALPPLDASDHVCFTMAGASGVMLSTLGPHGYYHTPQDTIDKILIDDLEAAVWLAWAGLLPIAMGEEDLYIEGAKGIDEPGDARHPRYRDR